MKLPAAVIFFFLSFYAVRSQTGEQTGSKGEREWLWWGTVGVGTASFPDNALVVGAGANLADGAALYGVRALVLEEFRLCISGGCDPNDHAAEVGFLYGRILRREYYSLSASGGLGVWFGAKYGADGGTGTYMEDRFVTAGVPLEVRAFFTPFPFAGIGITGFADINPQHSAAGVMFGLQLGRLRD